MAVDGGQIEISIDARIDNFNRKMYQVDNELGKLKRQSAIAIPVDTKQLHGLNDLIDKKIKHIGELRKEASIPIKPLYDPTSLSAGINQVREFRRELGGLKNDMMAGGSFSGTIRHQISVDSLRQDSLLASEIRGLGKQLDQDFRDVIKEVAHLRPGGVLSKVAGFAFDVVSAPIRIPMNIAGQAVNKIATGFAEEIGRTFAGEFATSGVRESSAKVKAGVRAFNNFVVGTDNYFETFLGELLDTGDFKKATEAAKPRSGIAKSLERIYKLRDIATQTNADAIDQIIQSDNELKKIYSTIENRPLASMGTTSKLQTLDKFLDLAQPKGIVDNVINPIIAEFQPLLKLIQGIQTYRTSKQAQQLYDQIKGNFPDLQNYSGAVSVGGGGQFAGGQGGRQIAMALEPFAPNVRFIPVENPNSDAPLPGEKRPAEDLIKKGLSTLLPDLMGDKDVANTVMNVARQALFAINPMATSTAAVQGLANTLAANQQGKEGRFVGYSMSGGMDAMSYARTAQYMGLQTNTLAMSYPTLGLSGVIPQNYQSAILKGDPLTFGNRLGLGMGFNAPGSSFLNTLGLSGTDAHDWKHLFKEPAFPPIFYNAIGSERPTGLSRKTEAGIAESTGNLYELIGIGEQLKSLMKTGDFDLQSPFKGFKTSQSAGGVFDIESLITRFFEHGAATVTLTRTGGKALHDLINQYFKEIEVELAKRLSDVGVKMPENPSDLGGYLKYQEEAKQTNQDLAAFKSGDSSLAGYFARDLSPEAVKGLNRQLSQETIKWFKDKGGQFGIYQDQIVKMYEYLQSVMDEFVANKGNLSEETKANIPIFPTDEFSLSGIFQSQGVGATRINTLDLPSDESTRLPSDPSLLVRMIGELPNLSRPVTEKAAQQAPEKESSNPVESGFATPKQAELGNIEKHLEMLYREVAAFHRDMVGRGGNPSEVNPPGVNDQQPADDIPPAGALASPEVSLFNKMMRSLGTIASQHYGVAKGIEKYAFDTVQVVSLGLVNLQAAKKVTQTVSPAIALGMAGHDLPLLGAGMDAISSGVVTPLLSHGIGAVGNGIAGLLPEGITSGAATAASWLGKIPGMGALGSGIGDAGTAALGGAGTILTYLLSGRAASGVGQFALNQVAKPLALLPSAVEDKTYNLLTGIGNFGNKAMTSLPRLMPRPVEHVYAELLAKETNTLPPATTVLTPLPPSRGDAYALVPAREESPEVKFKQLIDSLKTNRKNINDQIRVINDIIDIERISSIANYSKNFIAEKQSLGGLPDQALSSKGSLVSTNKILGGWKGQFDQFVDPKDILKKAHGMGVAIPDGILLALQERGHLPKDATVEMMRGMIASSKKTLKSNSPSLVFKEIGQDIVAGLDQGLDFSQVTQKVSGEMSGIVDSASTINPPEVGTEFRKTAMIEGQKLDLHAVVMKEIGWYLSSLMVNGDFKPPKDPAIRAALRKQLDSWMQELFSAVGSNTIRTTPTDTRSEKLWASYGFKEMEGDEHYGQMERVGLNAPLNPIDDVAVAKIEKLLKDVNELINKGIKKDDSIVAYRGSTGDHEYSGMGGGQAVFLATEKSIAEQYGKVAEYKLRSDLKLLDLSTNNNEARRMLFGMADNSTLKDLDVNSPDDLKDSFKFEELFTDSYSDTAIGMFPGKDAPSVIKTMGYDGVKTGDNEFWLAGKVGDYAANEDTPNKELNSQHIVKKLEKAIKIAKESGNKAAIELVDAIATQINHAFSANDIDVKALLKVVGLNINKGLTAGITGSEGEPIAAITNTSKKLITTAMDVLGEKSPSKVFIKIGENLAIGYKIGIVDGIAKIQDIEHLTLPFPDVKEFDGWKSIEHYADAFNRLPLTPIASKLGSNNQLNFAYQRANNLDASKIHFGGDLISRYQNTENFPQSYNKFSQEELNILAGSAKEAQKAIVETVADSVKAEAKAVELPPLSAIPAVPVRPDSESNPFIVHPSGATIPPNHSASVRQQQIWAAEQIEAEKERVFLEQQAQQQRKTQKTAFIVSPSGVVTPPGSNGLIPPVRPEEFVPLQPTVLAGGGNNLPPRNPPIPPAGASPNPEPPKRGLTVDDLAPKRLLANQYRNWQENRINGVEKAIAQAPQNADKGFWEWFNNILNEIEAGAGAAGAGIRGLGRIMGALEEKMPGLGRILENIKGFAGGLLMYMGFQQIEQVLVDFARQGIDTALQLERMKAALTYDSSINAASKLKEIAQYADDIGANALVAAQSFTKLTIAAANTTVAPQVQKIFEGFSTALVGQGATPDEQQRAFLSVVQMIGKGQILAEELRSQLAEVMPQAIGAMARSQGLTQEQLTNQMKNSKMFPETDLQPLAKQLAYEATLPINTVKEGPLGSIARFQNAQEKLQGRLGETILGVGKPAMDLAAGGMNALNSVATGLTASLGLLVTFLAGKFVYSLLDTATASRIVTIALKTLGLEFMTNNWMLNGFNAGLAKLNINLVASGTSSNIAVRGFASLLGAISGVGSALLAIAPQLIAFAAIGLVVDRGTKIWQSYHGELKKTNDELEQMINNLQRTKTLTGQPKDPNEIDRSSPDYLILGGKNPTGFNAKPGLLSSIEKFLAGNFNYAAPDMDNIGKVVIDYRDEKGNITKSVRIDKDERRDLMENLKQADRNVAGSKRLISIADANFAKPERLAEGKAAISQLDREIAVIRTRLANNSKLGGNNREEFKNLSTELAVKVGKREEAVNGYFGNQIALEQMNKALEASKMAVQKNPDTQARNAQLEAIAKAMSENNVMLEAIRMSTGSINQKIPGLQGASQLVSSAGANIAEYNQGLVSRRNNQLLDARLTQQIDDIDLQRQQLLDNLITAQRELLPVKQDAETFKGFALNGLEPSVAQDAMNRLELRGRGGEKYKDPLDMIMNTSVETMKALVESGDGISGGLKTFLEQSIKFKEKYQQANELEGKVLQAQIELVKLHQQRLNIIRQANTEIAASNTNTEMYRAASKGKIGTQDIQSFSAYNDLAKAKSQLENVKALFNDKNQDPVDLAKQLASANEAVAKAEFAVTQSGQNTEEYYRGLGQSVEDFNRSVLETEIGWRQQIRDFGWSVQDSARNAFIETRGLQEAWADLQFDLEGQLLAAQNELKNTSEKLRQAKATLAVESISFQPDSIGKKTASIFVDFLANIGNLEGEGRSLDEKQRQLGQEYVTTLRRIRDEQEKQLRAEEERTRAMIRLNEQFRSLMMQMESSSIKLGRELEQIITRISKEAPGSGYQNYLPNQLPERPAYTSPAGIDPRYGEAIINQPQPVQQPQQTAQIIEQPKPVVVPIQQKIKLYPQGDKRSLDDLMGMYGNDTPPIIKTSATITTTHIAPITTVATPKPAIDPTPKPSKLHTQPKRDVEKEVRDQLPTKPIYQAPAGPTYQQPQAKLTVGKEYTFTAPTQPNIVQQTLNAIGNYLSPPAQAATIPTQTWEKNLARLLNQYGSRMTVEDFKRASAKSGINIDALVTQAFIESHFGTKGRGRFTKNPLNYGNDDAGNNKYFKTYGDGLEYAAIKLKKDFFFTSPEDFMARDFKGRYGRYATDPLYKPKYNSALTKMRRILYGNLRSDIPKEFKIAAGISDMGNPLLADSRVKTVINAKGEPRKILDSKDPNAITKFKAEQFKNDTQFNGKSLDEILKYQKGLYPEAFSKDSFYASQGIKFLGGQTPAKGKNNVDPVKAVTEFFLGAQAQAMPVLPQPPSDPNSLRNQPYKGATKSYHDQLYQGKTQTVPQPPKDPITGQPEYSIGGNGFTPQQFGPFDTRPRLQNPNIKKYNQFPTYQPIEPEQGLNINGGNVINPAPTKGVIDQYQPQEINTYSDLVSSIKDHNPVTVQDTSGLTATAGQINDIKNKTLGLNRDLIETQKNLELVKFNNAFLQQLQSLQDMSLGLSRKWEDNKDKYNELAIASKGYKNSLDEIVLVGQGVTAQFRQQNRAFEDEIKSLTRQLEGNTEAIATIMTAVAAKEAELTKSGRAMTDGERKQMDSMKEKIALYVKQDSVLEAQRQNAIEQQKAMAAWEESTRRAAEAFARLDQVMKNKQGYAKVQADLYKTRYDVGAQNDWGMGTLIDPSAVINARMQAAQAKVDLDKQIREGNYSPQQASEMRRFQAEISELNIKRSFVDAIPGLKEFSSGLKDAILHSNGLGESLNKVKDVVLGMMLEQLAIKPFQNAIAEWIGPMLGLDSKEFYPQVIKGLGERGANAANNIVPLDLNNTLATGQGLPDTIDLSSAFTSLTESTTNTSQAMDNIFLAGITSTDPAMVGFILGLTEATTALTVFAGALTLGGGGSFVNAGSNIFGNLFNAGNASAGQSVADSLSGGFTGSISHVFGFADGGPVDPLKIDNYAGGGLVEGISQAMDRERSQSGGKQPILAVLNTDEYVISANEASDYRNYKDWSDRMAKDVKNFAQGGPVSYIPNTTQTNTSEGTVNNFNQTIKIEVANTNDLGKSMSQIERDRQLSKLRAGVR